jgi:hypothetical protein
VRLLLLLFPATAKTAGIIHPQFLGKPHLVEILFPMLHAGEFTMKHSIG